MNVPFTGFNVKKQNKYSAMQTLTYCVQTTLNRIQLRVFYFGQRRIKHVFLYTTNNYNNIFKINLCTGQQLLVICCINSKECDNICVQEGLTVSSRLKACLHTKIGVRWFVF